MIRLNLGSSKYKLEGYKNIDIDPECNPDECYDILKGIKEAEVPTTGRGKTSIYSI